jgi:hypothetical protein
VDEVRIVVYEFNQEALQFYERLGYETGRRTLWHTLQGDQASHEASRMAADQRVQEP